MTIKERDKQHLEDLADDTLNKFDEISKAVANKEQDEVAGNSSSLASLNTFTDGPAIDRLAEIERQNRSAHEALKNEPAIARVVVVDEDREEIVYFISRATPVGRVSNLASYRSPVGRLASLEIGAEHQLPQGTVVEVLENAQLRPTRIQDQWDSRYTVIESESIGPLTVESLRELLAGRGFTDDLLGQMLAADDERANVVEGVRHEIITKMGLRDQPVLDQYQDEIFRLPLNAKLLILGPPGTGKTTTLIRRLGQKLDVEYLESEEQNGINQIEKSGGESHKHSWLMFTPTDLLQQYLKEAFAREGVAASDIRIRTWSDYRKTLARSSLPVLRSGSRKAGLVMKEATPILADDIVSQTIEWFEDFDVWQRNNLLESLNEAALILAEAEQDEICHIGGELVNMLDATEPEGLPELVVKVAPKAAQIESIIKALKQATDEEIKGALNLELNRDKGFIDELSTFLDSLRQGRDSDVGDDDEPELDEDEDDTSTPRRAAISAYLRVVRARARALAAGQFIGSKSRTAQILDWIGDRRPDDDTLKSVGASLLIQRRARPFTNLARQLIDGVPRRYRAFRKVRQKEGRWYVNESMDASHVSPLEVDLLVLAMLRPAARLLERNEVARNLDEGMWSSLRPAADLMKNQILVDEATDFSPIQLACMACLAHHRMQSFFACGDFNQRLTTWGTRSVDELKWIFPQLEVREITTAYRQSRRLNVFARGIVQAAGGNPGEAVLPRNMDYEGVAPVLLEQSPNDDDIAKWLAERIQEIEQLVRQLPSTAVFVNSPEGVEPVAAALNTALEDYNLQAVACIKGQAMGQDTDVRVFDVQHIKGLEFEAVFFVGIDRLADHQPELFDKYLYVGATRAATYLGLTCDTKLPPRIAELRDHFTERWDTGSDS